MSLHDWLGRHEPDHASSRWDRGAFVSRCVQCGRSMVKPPGLGWTLGEAA